MKLRQLLFLLVLPLLFTCSESEDFSGEENHILNLQPLKDQFKDHFLIGNIMNPGEVTHSYLTHHFNVLTCENNMKPGYLAPSKGSYSFGTADSMVNTAISSGFKVVGHTLLWHSQNAGWMNSSVTLDDMKKYITDVVGHFKGKIYSWDVLNEVFPDSGYTTSSNWKDVMRKGNWGNPWYTALGSEFVYEGFLAARLADPEAILYYNDYNTDNSTKATMIRNMVKDVNEEYKKNLESIKAANPGVTLTRTELLIEGIGMQEHHNTWVQASAIKATLELFKPLGVRISVSELDVLSQTYGDFADKKKVTAEGRAAQAKLYGDYMKVYLEYSSMIERVSLWGVTDNQSWRKEGEPLLFNASGMAKPAYHSFVGALSK